MRTLLLSLLLASTPAFAGQLDGVTMPDTVTVGGQKLVLNGLGLREKYWLNIYVGALYLPEKTTDPAKAISEDVPKRITMHFVFHHVSKSQLCDSYDESLDKQADKVKMKPLYDKMCTMMHDVYSGDEVVIDYVPGTGTTFSIKGQKVGTIEGTDFMKSMWTVYVGPNPPTAALKKGLMGG